jgi:hypothetical protein
MISGGVKLRPAPLNVLFSHKKTFYTNQPDLYNISDHVTSKIIENFLGGPSAMKWNVSLIASAAALLLIIGSVSAQALDERPGPPGMRPGKPPRGDFQGLPGPPGERGRPGPRFEDDRDPPPLSPKALQDKLGLSERQVEDLRTKMNSHRAQMEKFRANIMPLMEEKRNMMMSGKINQERLIKIDEEIVRVRSDMLRERLKMERDRLLMLSPDQVKRFSELMPKTEERRMPSGRRPGPPE